MLLLQPQVAAVIFCNCAKGLCCHPRSQVILSQTSNLHWTGQSRPSITHSALRLRNAALNMCSGVSCRSKPRSTTDCRDCTRPKRRSPHVWPMLRCGRPPSMCRPCLPPSRQSLAVKVCAWHNSRSPMSNHGLHAWVAVALEDAQEAQSPHNYHHRCCSCPSCDHTGC